MVQTANDLRQLRGVGPILAKRLYDSGYDSFAKIAQANEEELKKVRGISPRAVSPILEQAKKLAEAPEEGHPDRAETVRKQLSEVREKIQEIALSARERYQDQLTGKTGKKLSTDLVRMENALGQMGADGKKPSKRAAKALQKAEKRFAGLEDASLKKIRKALKRARKGVLKAL